jgi:hypothetical protein
MSGVDPKKDKKGNVRITWARSLSDRDIANLLQMKLLESRATRETHVSLLNELVHEVKHRLDPRRKAADADARGKE